MDQEEGQMFSVTPWTVSCVSGSRGTWLHADERGNKRSDVSQQTNVAALCDPEGEP